MSDLLKDGFKLYNIQFNLKKLSDGREIIAFLRYAWYVDEYSPKERLMISELNELITAAVKRIDPVAMESIKDIEYDTNLICLRNSFRLPFANVDVVPSFNDSTDGAELFVGRDIPTFGFQIYSAGNLLLLDFQISICLIYHSLWILMRQSGNIIQNWQTIIGNT